MASAHFFAYIFFRAPKNRTEEEKNACSNSLFEQWMNSQGLKEGKPFDLGHPELTHIRQAQNEERDISLLRLDEIDILKIHRMQTATDEDPLTFWENCVEELKKHPPDKSCHFGLAHVLCLPSDDFLKEIQVPPEYAEIPGSGRLYQAGEHSFLMISQKPAAFLGRDFPVILSFLQKLTYQDDISQDVKSRNRVYRTEIEKLTALDRLRDIESNFNSIKTYQAYLGDNLISLSKIHQNFDINLLNLENYLKTLRIQEDTLFTRVIRKAEKARRQLRFDLNHARLNLDRVNGQLKLVELGIEKQRINEQSRIKQLITVIGVTFGMGQVAANEAWDTKLLLMCIAMLAISLIVWFLNRDR
ncbi:MAG: hypothetical protein B6245_09670 [Desulfobacteraceae bacterium 4572_88]|nr:MAG: hypothetical protein B6245_09670 [Desulfobacteraceae bacterium 4572_88]